MNNISKYFIFFGFYLLILPSCVQVSDTLETIEIDLNKDYVFPPIEKIVDSIEFVILETNSESILPDKTQCRLAFSKDYILIYNTVNKKLLLFDYDGKFISSICYYGRGPFEYTNVFGLFCTADEIIVINEGRSAIFYSFSGVPTREITFPERILSLIELCNNEYGGIVIDTEHYESLSYVILNEEFKICDKLPIQISCEKPKYLSMTRLVKHKYDILITAYPFLETYRIWNDRLVPHRKIDFGPSTISCNDDLGDPLAMKDKSFLMTWLDVGSLLFITGGCNGIKTKMFDSATGTVHNVRRIRNTNAYSIPNSTGDDLLFIFGLVRDNLVYGLLNPDEFNIINDLNRYEHSGIKYKGISNVEELEISQNFIIQLSYLKSL